MILCCHSLSCSTIKDLRVREPLSLSATYLDNSHFLESLELTLQRQNGPRSIDAHNHAKLTMTRYETQTCSSMVSGNGMVTKLLTLAA